MPLTAEVLMIGDEQQLARSVADLGLIGIDRVVGYAGPDVVAAWQQSGRSLENVRTVSVADAARRVQGGGIAVLDVRTAAERAQGTHRGLDCTSRYRSSPVGSMSWTESNQ